MTVILRTAEAADSYALWLWANDPAARAGSGDRGPIEWDHHQAWVAERIASAGALVLIAQSTTGRPLGTIRFETEDGWAAARLSYSVAPESRGQGIGRALLERGPGVLARTRAGTRLVAVVRPTNGVSRHLFATLGWAEEGSTPELIRFVRPAGRLS